MKVFNWNPEKNQKLMENRKISFEDIVMAIDEGNLLDVLEHHNRDKYPGQRIFVVNARDYVWLVPFVENDSEVFLKTIIPCRKAKRDYGETDD